MSSLPKAPSPTHQAAGVSKQSSFKDRHYQTVYDDGRSRCIVESRRRPRMVRGTYAADIGRPQPWSVVESDLVEPPERLLRRGFLRYPASQAPSSKSEGLASSRERCVKLSPKCPRSVVIVPASMRLNTPRLREHASSQRWSEPTPPPTPRLQRLPSPELSDLDEAPFCECDEAAMSRHCTSCKKPTDPLGI